MRATQHNRRIKTDKHNDRNFDMSSATHIDQTRTQFNLNWSINGASTFAKAEHQFYTETFSNFLKKRNEKYIAQRHKERVQSIDDYRKSLKSCPEEQIVQIGKMGNHTDAQTLYEIFKKQMQWEMETYPQAVPINFSVHLDEATPHVHVRRVWVSHDKDGDLKVGQADALKEMGIERPNPDAKSSRYNNAKMSYTADCRAHLEELCREHGIELEEERLELAKTGQTLSEYKAQEEQAKIVQLQNLKHDLESELELIKEALNSSFDQKNKVDQEVNEAKRRLELAKQTPIDHSDLLKRAEALLMEIANGKNKPIPPKMARKMNEILSRYRFLAMDYELNKQQAYRDSFDNAAAEARLKVRNELSEALDELKRLKAMCERQQAVLEAVRGLLLDIPQELMNYFPNGHSRDMLLNPNLTESQVHEYTLSMLKGMTDIPLKLHSALESIKKVEHSKDNDFGLRMR